MSYERNGDVLVFDASDFDTTFTISLRGPKGKAGTLVDFGVQNVTETFAGTTPANMTVGDGTTADLYGKALGFGTLASGEAKTARSTYDPTADAVNYLATLPRVAIPKDSKVVITGNAGGTGQAGIANPYIKIRWDD